MKIKKIGAKSIFDSRKQRTIQVIVKTEKQFISKQDKIFICKPDIQNDIYHLYTFGNEYIGLAAIPDYKTSVMMNQIFRIIKENNDDKKLIASMFFLL